LKTGFEKRTRKRKKRTKKKRKQRKWPDVRNTVVHLSLQKV